MARLGAPALLLASLLATGTAAAEPPCVEQCREMAAKGQLKAGVNEMGCKVRVCQEDGRRLYRENKHQEALDALEVLQADLGLSPSFQLDIGVVYYALGNFEEALVSFDFVLKRFPESIRAGAQRGYALMRLRRFDEALAQFEKLLDVPASRGEFRGLRMESFVRGNIGAIQLMLGDMEKGRKSLKQALTVDGGNGLAATYLFRVIPSVEAGDLEQEGLYLLLVSSEDVGLQRYQSAEENLNKLIAGWPKFAEAYQLQAELLLATHRYAECEKNLRQAEKYHPDDIDLKARRIRCSLLRHGPLSDAAEAAIAEAQELRKKHPDNLMLRDILLAINRS